MSAIPIPRLIAVLPLPAHVGRSTERHRFSKVIVRGRGGRWLGRVESRHSRRRPTDAVVPEPDEVGFDQLNHDQLMIGYSPSGPSINGSGLQCFARRMGSMIVTVSFRTSIPWPCDSDMAREKLSRLICLLVHVPGLYWS